MSKSKKVFRFIGQLLKENWLFLLLYLLMAGLFASTFFLYNIPYDAYLDAILFTLPIIAGFIGVRGIILWRKHEALQKLLQQDWFHLLEDFPQSQKLIEQDYQLLLEKLGKQIQQQNDQQEVQYNELIDYYGLWTHQIKTPLAALDLMVQTLEQPTKKEMKDEIFKIQQYLDMMLQYLRLQNIQNDFRFAELKIKPIVAQVVKKYASFFIYKDLEIELENLDGIIISDEKWLTFILEQIIFNAIKYTATGKIMIYSPIHKPQEIHIKDTGRGILAEDIPRVFERGYTGFNGRENQKASGLGLFMSQEIAKELGLTLQLTSEVGKGTEVVIDASQQFDKQQLS